ncbi:FAD-binding protein [soil metagenome]
MIRSFEIVLTPFENSREDLTEKLILQRLKDEITLSDSDKVIIKKDRCSIDARSRQPVFRLLIIVYINEEPKEEKAVSDILKINKTAKKVIIIGAGPAGYFAAIELLEHGIQPIIFDRGKNVQERRKDLRAIQQFGIVNPDSNYCFGEGGAGTYSDGKLYTRSHKRGDISKALNILVRHGAHHNILIDAHPHIGSNKLPKVVENLRETILNAGGEIHFDSLVTDILIKNNNASGVVINHEKEFFAEDIILASGHSSRDIFYLLKNKNILIEPKPFAMGVRIEHPQELIDQIQYHQKKRDDNLPAASYKAVAQIGDRGVFSFCMCPGGLIVPASTAPGELVVNGMSMSRRDSKYANSGIVMQVEIDDLTADRGKTDPLIGLNFQSKYEKMFFNANNEGTQAAPAQRMTDFINKKISSDLPDTSYIPGIFSADMNSLLPPKIAIGISKALIEFGKKMKGYLTEEGMLIGLESRTSSPVRIPRSKETYEHPEIKGLFPTGEGAGYAGGIISAALDGQNSAKAIARKYV